MSQVQWLAGAIKNQARTLEIGSGMSLPFFMILWASGILVGLIYMVSDWSVFLTGVLILAALTMAFIKPEYAFYLMLLLLPVTMTSFQYDIKKSNYLIAVCPYMFAAALAAIALFVRGALEKNPPGILKTPLTGIVLFAVGYLCMTLVWAPNKSLGLIMGAFLLLHAYIFFMIVHFIRDADSLRRTINVLMVMGVITSTGVILSQWETYDERFFLGSEFRFQLYFGTKTNAGAGFGGSTDMAGILSTLAFLAAGRSITAKNSRDKALHGILASYLTVGMIIATCRGALVGMVTGIVFLMIAHPFTRRNVIKYSAITFILLFVTILVAKPSYIDRIMIGFGYTGTLYFSGDLGEASSYTGSEVGTTGMDARKEWWKSGLAAMAEKPLTFLFGLGLGGFITHSGANHTHSVPLSFFFDMGLVGVVILMIGVMILLRQSIFYMIRAKRTYTYYMFVTAAAAFLAEICLHGLIDYDFYSHSARMFWVPLGYLLATLNIVKNENPELESEVA